VLIVSVVHNEAVIFKIVDENQRDSEGVNFPFARLMGKVEQLNHANFPDPVYYCAINHGKHSGALGGKTGIFVKSRFPTVTDTRVLDKLCKHSSLGLELSDANSERWKHAAEDLGTTVSDQYINRNKRKLQRNQSNTENDDDKPPISRQRTRS